MSRQRHARAKALFLGAVDRPPDERRAWLDAQCGGDLPLRREVDSLLAFLDAPGLEPQPLPLPLEPMHRAPSRIGPYRLLQRLGHGGMGDVFEAEQESPVRRRVALKLIKPGMDTAQVIARFESERQALALMSHPNITRVFDAGSTEGGRPYFVMECVRGTAITDFCSSRRLDIRQRLHLFLQVCDGIQHAHRRGIIHRDIKPSNVLVSEEDGKPVPKIIDFGIAKAVSQPLTDDTYPTQLGQWIGTPEFMSPEQTGLPGLDVDTRTDVYSLGVLLYELLTGAPPFERVGPQAESIEQLTDRIRHQDPERPSRRVSRGTSDGAPSEDGRSVARASRRQLQGDLDWITMKALEKDRDRRYDSPALLAADIRRHLQDRTVHAYPPSTTYRLGKFARRHRVGVLAAALILLALTVGMVGTGLGLMRARRAEGLAQQEARSARQVSEFLVGIFDVLDPGTPQGGGTTPQEVLARGSGRIEELSDQPLMQARLKNTMGRIYSNLGFFAEAQPLLQDALHSRRRLLGNDHPEVAESLEDLGWLLRRSGQLTAAADAFEQALKVNTAIFGPDHPEVARSLSALAYMRWIHDRFDEAGTLFERALRIRLNHLGPDHPDVAETLAHQGILWIDTADYAKAETSLSRALEIRRQAFGDDHPAVAWSRHDLGWLYFRKGQLDEAEGHLQASLRISERLYGPDHPNIAWPLNKLGLVARLRGHLDEAQALHQRALDIRQSSLRAGHLEIAWSLEAMGELAVARQQYEKALSFLEPALATWEKSLGPHHSGVAFALAGLATAHQELGHPEQAEALWRRVLAIREQRLGTDHPFFARSLLDYAILLRRLGREDEAQALEQRAAEVSWEIEAPRDQIGGTGGH